MPRKTKTDDFGFDAGESLDTPHDADTTAQNAPRPALRTVAPEADTQGAPATEPVVFAAATADDDLPTTFVEVMAERTRLSNLPQRPTPAEAARHKRLDDLFLKMQNGIEILPVEPSFRDHPSFGDEYSSKVHLRLKERLHDIARRHPKLAAQVQAELAKLDATTP